MTIGSNFLLACIIAAILSIPLSVWAADEPNIVRVGFIANTNPEKNPVHMNAFHEGLREKGLIQGKNLAIEYRWVVGSFSQKPDLVPNLIENGVDIIVAWGSAATAAAKKATSTIPIVMIAVSDPIGTGFVKSLAKPGGNITGVTNVSREIAGKWVELLLQINPGMKSVAAIRNPANPASVLSAAEVEKAAQKLALECIIVDVRAPDDIAAAFDTMKQEGANAMVITGEPMFASQRRRFADLAVEYRLPSTFIVNIYPKAGGLLSYGPDPKYLFRSAAHYVAKIAEGSAPSDLPVERPTIYELTINQKTAQAIGVSIPHAVLLRTDKFID
jgi:putative ABC transport system substrate-binding protein